MLSSAAINSIKSNISNAVSAKNPQGVANAVELPPLYRRTSPSGGAGGSSQPAGHREHLKVDGADWSPVLNSILDCHAAISSVSTYFWGVLTQCLSLALHARARELFIGVMSIYQSKGLLNTKWQRSCVLVLYNVRGFLTFISMEIHPSDIPCCMPLISDVDRNPVLQHFFIFLFRPRSHLVFAVKEKSRANI
jgi:hypothetical protein